MARQFAWHAHIERSAVANVGVQHTLCGGSHRGCCNVPLSRPSGLHSKKLDDYPPGRVSRRELRALGGHLAVLHHLLVISSAEQCKHELEMVRNISWRSRKRFSIRQGVMPPSASVWLN